MRSQMILVMASIGVLKRRWAGVGEIPDGHRWHSSPKIRFAPDSPLEGRGFEPSVPRKIETALSRPSFSPLRHHVQPERSTRAIRRFGCKRRRLRSNFIAAHLGETKDYAQWPRYLGISGNGGRER